MCMNVCVCVYIYIHLITHTHTHTHTYLVRREEKEGKEKTEITEHLLNSATSLTPPHTAQPTHGKSHTYTHLASQCLQAPEKRGN